MVGAGGTQRKDEEAARGGDEPQGPIAVLVDQNTASASEIVAAAVRTASPAAVSAASIRKPIPPPK